MCTLDEWLRKAGTGSINRLSVRAGVSLPVVARARKGRANLASATKLHLATGREVPIKSMTGDDVPEALEAPPARAAKGSRR